jgi:hypothetical protein
MLTNYYKAKLSAQGAAVQDGMLAAQAERALALADGSPEQTAVFVDYYDTHLRTQCFAALRYHVQQVQSFQFMALRDCPGPHQGA